MGLKLIHFMSVCAIFSVFTSRIDAFSSKASALGFQQYLDEEWKRIEGKTRDYEGYNKSDFMEIAGIVVESIANQIESYVDDKKYHNGKEHGDKDDNEKGFNGTGHGDEDDNEKAFNVMDLVKAGHKYEIEDYVSNEKKAHNGTGHGDEDAKKKGFNVMDLVLPGLIKYEIEDYVDDGKKVHN